MNSLFFRALEESNLAKAVRQKEEEYARKSLEMRGIATPGYKRIGEEILRNRISAAVVALLVAVTIVFIIYVSIRVNPIRKAASIYLRGYNLSR